MSFLDQAIETTAHADLDIVKETWEKNRTIVTSNRRDFIRYIHEFQNPPNYPSCQDLWGLLVIPDIQLVREKGLRAVQHGLNVSRREPLRWAGAVYSISMCV
jgi:hypothetical protein